MLGWESLKSYSRSVEMCGDVVMCRSATIMASVKGRKPRHAIIARRLDTARKRCSREGCVGRAAVGRSNDSAVDASRIRVPELDVNIGQRLAGGDVNDLHVENHVNALLSLVLLPQVAAHHFPDDPVWTFGDNGSQNA